MNITMFLTLLFAFSLLSGLFVEGFKKLIKDKENISYNVVALIISMVIGCGGTVCYYQFTNIPYTTNNIICIVLMGIFSALCSMVGYDKVIQTIEQILSHKQTDVQKQQDVNIK